MYSVSKSRYCVWSKLLAGGSMRQLATGIGATLFLLGAAHAGPNEAPALSAEKAYQQAETHYQSQEYQAALALYLQAYQINGEPAMLFNVAQCERHLGMHAEAITHFRAFLERVPASPYRKEIEELIKRSEDVLAASLPTSTPGPLVPGAPREASYGLAYGLGAGGLGLLGLGIALGISTTQQADATRPQPNAITPGDQILAGTAHLGGIGLLSAAVVLYWKERRAQHEGIR